MATTTPTAAHAVQAHSAAIIKAIIQGCILTTISNVLAQVLRQYRAQDNAPITLNATPILHFVLLTILNTPPNFIWQEYLESSYPAYGPETPSCSSSAAALASEKSSFSSSAARASPPSQKKLNLTNTLIKFVLDQSVGAVYNTVAFLVVMQAFRGASAGEIWEVVRRDSYSLMAAGIKVWPAVSLLSFTVVPPNQRMLFGSLVGMGWNIFLALLVS